MFSPQKLASIDENSKELGSNFELANRLKSFLTAPSNEGLWNINTTRQTVTPALRHTKMIPLRINVAPRNNNPKNTTEWNQITTISDGPLLHVIPIFTETHKWLRSFFAQHCNTVEFGRIFFSKLSPSSVIDKHVDDGKYFDYYDRFHFIIQGNDENIFFIREESIRLTTGKIYWINNHVEHWLENNSTEDRINLILDARLS